MINLNTQKHLREDLLILSRYFIFFVSSIFFFIISFETYKYHVYYLYRISYTLSFCYVKYYIMSEICISGRFKTGPYFSSQKFISVVANESLISYNLIKRAAEIQNLWYCNTECQPKRNQENVKYSLVLRTKDFVPHKRKQ